MSAELAPQAVPHRTDLIGYQPEIAPTFQEWADSFVCDLRGMYYADNDLRWINGDKYLYGEAHFPEQFTQALPDPNEDDDKIPEETVRSNAWICERFPIHKRRVRETSHGVHKELAAIPNDEDRYKALDRAVAEHWTVKDAADYKKQYLGKSKPAAAPTVRIPVSDAFKAVVPDLQARLESLEPKPGKQASQEYQRLAAWINELVEAGVIEA